MAKILGFSFEAGDSSAGINAVIIIIYFMFFAFVASAVDNVADISFTDNANLYNTTSDSLRTNYQYCSSPRYKWEIGSNDPVELKSYNEPTLRCDITRGLLSSDECHALNGCDWVNVTTNKWLCWLPIIDCDTLETCEGNLNVSGIGDTAIITAPLGDVAGYDYDSYVGLSTSLLTYLNMDGFEGNSICLHPATLQNKTACEYFECTWNNVNATRQITLETTSQNFFNMIINVFKFDYVFNFSNDALNILLYMIFILIPFILLWVFIFYAIFGAK